MEDVAESAMAIESTFEHDVYIIHSQETGQDQCALLFQALRSADLSVWLDMQAHDLTAQGMKDALSKSRAALLFLSDGVMARDFCIQELRWAKENGCKFVGVMEDDARHGKADVALEKSRAPADLKHLLDDVEFIAYRRRAHESEAMVRELVKRIAGHAR